MDFPQYDELYVISDLHMGGDRPDFQILRATQRLARFVRWVAAQRPGDRVALVLNGDVIDTLAEDTGGYVAIDNAVTVVDRIISRDPSFSPVWDALRDFVKTPNRVLVIVIGNHDIELALPPVQHLIASRLAGDNAENRGRIEFATVGAGYTCTIGNARVFCTHGNEVDPWNYVRYEDLSKAARRMNAGRSLDASEWEPNAGTKLVKDVMNDVKRRYAWIDLMKPETQAALGVLVVLDPKQAEKIGRLPAIVTRLATGARDYGGRLAVDVVPPSPAGAPLAVPLDKLLGPNVGESMRATSDDMLLAAERSYQTSRGRSSENQTLGTPQLIWDRLTGWIKGVGPDEALRRALLDWLKDDKTFDVDNQDYTFKQVTASVGTGVDVVVTGHSHLARAIDMGGGRFYFNCGTWIRLMRFTTAILKNTDTFKPAYTALTDGTMRALDEAKFDGVPFVLDRTTAVRIHVDGGGKTTGALLQVDDSDGVVQPEREFVRPSA